MPVSVDDVKGVVSRLLDESLAHVSACEDLMDHVQSKEDILRFRYMPEALIQLRGLLDRVNLSALSAASNANLQYVEPPLRPPPAEDAELMALFQFFKRMHVTLWEVRVKLKGLSGVLNMVNDLEKAAVLLKLSKTAHEAIHAPVSRMEADLPVLLAERKRQSASVAAQNPTNVVRLTRVDPPTSLSVSVTDAESPAEDDGLDVRIESLQQRQVDVLFALRDLGMRLKKLELTSAR